MWSTIVAVVMKIATVCVFPVAVGTAGVGVNVPGVGAAGLGDANSICEGQIVAVEPFFGVPWRAGKAYGIVGVRVGPVIADGESVIADGE